MKKILKLKDKLVSALEKFIDTNSAFFTALSSKIAQVQNDLAKARNILEAIKQIGD